MKIKKKKLSEADILIQAKVKMKKIHVYNISNIEVQQFSNWNHEIQHESSRINAPDELEDGKTYRDSTIGAVRGVSIKIE